MAPVARGYKALLPSIAREGVNNFFANTQDVLSAVNLVLQKRPVDAASDLTRFLVNGTIGVFGIFDVATRLGLERHRESFSQTLGYWNVAPGPYVVWPLLGPSTLRNSVDIPIGYFTAPQNFISNQSVSNSISVIELVHQRASLLGVGEIVDQIALDKYLFVRDAYFQRLDAKSGQEKVPDDASE